MRFTPNRIIKQNNKKITHCQHIVASMVDLNAAEDVVAAPSDSSTPSPSKGNNNKKPIKQMEPRSLFKAMSALCMVHVGGIAPTPRVIGRQRLLCSAQRTGQDNVCATRKDAHGLRSGVNNASAMAQDVLV